MSGGNGPGGRAMSAPNGKVLRFPAVVNAMLSVSRPMTREEREEFDAANRAAVRPIHRCAGGCDAFVSSPHAYCLTCAAREGAA